MRKSLSLVQIFISWCLALALAGCGGGSGSNLTTAPSALAPGTTMDMTANSSVLVPSGTVISSPDGTSITVNGSSNTIYTQAGAVVDVPPSASGPATNLVSTGAATAGGISTSPATVTVIAGSAIKNDTPTDGTGTAAILWGGGHMVFDHSGNIIVSDRGTLRKVTQQGVVKTLWGDLGSGNPVNFGAIATDGAGNIYGNGPDANFISVAPNIVTGASIVEYTASGIVQTLVTDWVTYVNNSAGWGGLARDGGGSLYAADPLNNRIVKFDTTGTMSVFAGSGVSGAEDGSGTSAAFSLPSDLAIDKNGNLFVTDVGNAAIRKITPTGIVSTYAKVNSLATGAPIAIDPEGNLYVGGTFQSILRVDLKGNVTSFEIPGVSDFITALLADDKGNLFASTRGVGGQILKISF